MLCLILMLFTFWIILSGKFDAFHLGIGAVSAVCIALGTRRLLLLAPAIGPAQTHPMDAVPWLRLLLYVPWLIWQIVLSSLHIAAVVVHPKMPIQPRLVRFRTPLPHNLARLTLATSITMTPGTITLDVQGDEFLVHALTEKSAQSLIPSEAEGSMQNQVLSLYYTAHTARSEDG
ncbi:MAG TPA: Na+/H+ antiporter subunit E [Candidatus Entotheonella sp.]